MIQNLARFLLAAAAVSVLQPLPAAQRHWDAPDFHGTVVDESSQPLPGVDVVLTVDGATFRTRTDPEGAYRFDCTPDGEATLSFSLEGFRRITAGPFRFRYPDSVRWDQTLRLGDIDGHRIVPPVRRLVLHLEDDLGRPVFLRVVEAEGIGRGRTDRCGRVVFSLGEGATGVVDTEITASRHAPARLKVDLSEHPADARVRLVLRWLGPPE